MKSDTGSENCYTGYFRGGNYECKCQDDPLYEEIVPRGGRITRYEISYAEIFYVRKTETKERAFRELQI